MYDPSGITYRVSHKEALYCYISISYKLYTYNNHILYVSQNNRKNYYYLPYFTKKRYVCDTKV